MQERRKHQRRRTFLGAQVAFAQRSCVVDCLVRNLSHGGARLAFSDHALIPDEFDLMIPHKGDSRRARILWRYESSIGVHFLENDLNYDHGELSVEATQRIRSLKKQSAALARRVTELSQAAC